MVNNLSAKQSYFHDFSALENVEIAMISFNGNSIEESNKKSKKILDLVGLSPKDSNHFPSDLSGGEHAKSCNCQSFDK